MPYRDDLPRTRDVARETGRFGGFGLIVGIGVLVVVGLLSWGVWAFVVGTSDVRGQGNAVRQKNTATNRIAAQERFEDLHQQILASDKRIDVMATALKAHPRSLVAQTNLTGVVTFCQQVVADYNAEARKYTARDFRAIDLPAVIDDLDPTTDCQETKKP